jgi:hypothetical protein
MENRNLSALWDWRKSRRAGDIAVRKIAKTAPKALIYGLFLALLPVLANASAAQMIAVLQDIARDDGGANRTALRLGFVAKGEEWLPLCHPDSNNGCLFRAPAVSRWQLRANGKEVGTATTQGWFDPSLIAANGLLRVTTPTSLFQGPRSHVFAGWFDKPVHRPLVALSSPLPDGPPNWTRVRATDADARLMLPLLARVSPRVPDCTNGEPAKDKGRALTADDVHVGEVWQGTSGERLLSASLKPERVKTCDYTADLLADVWGHDDGHAHLNAISLLSESEATHVLVDTGDFGGDGKEEFLFFLSGYNEDGFILVYDHFRRSARFSWSYQ